MADQLLTSATSTISLGSDNEQMYIQTISNKYVEWAKDSSETRWHVLPPNQGITVAWDGYFRSRSNAGDEYIVITRF